MKTFRSFAALFALGIALAASAPAQVATTTAPESVSYEPCRVHRKVPVKYPLKLEQQGVRQGEALFVIEVDEEGTLRDALVVAYTHEEFAAAALSALREWEFSPAAINGRPANARVHLVFNFEVQGVLVTERAPNTEPASRDRFGHERYAYRPYALNELDEPIKAIRRFEPLYPQEWISEGRTGVVKIDFYIDENGGTRMVVPVGVVDDYLAAVAVDAVRQWQFEPARHRGRPALVRAQQVFVFGKKTT